MKDRKVLIIGVVGLVILGSMVFSRSNRNKTETGRVSRKESSRVVKRKKGSSKTYVTARQAYEAAKKEVMKWDKDAYLIDVEQFMGSNRTDGKTDFWEFKFASNNKETAYKVKVADGKVSAAGEYAGRDKKFLGRVPDNWIDSNQAMKIALDNLKEIQCRSYWLGLSGEKWRVKCSRVEGGTPRWVDIKAVSGEFLRFRDDY